MLRVIWWNIATTQAAPIGVIYVVVTGLSNHIRLKLGVLVTRWMAHGRLVTRQQKNMAVWLLNLQKL
ncbi:hypothetical protein D3C79_1105380 [compost metagenome]